MTKNIQFIIIILLFICKSSFVFSQNTSDKSFIIATGSRGGNYYKTGEFIKTQYNQFLKEYNFSIIETNGSNENIDLLKKNAVDFAIVQRNILINNIYDEGKGTKNLAVILPLFQEKLWIYTKGKKPLNIRKIDSLSKVNQQIIGFSSKKGYSYKIYKILTKFLNINDSNLSEKEDNYNNLIKQFSNNELDYIVSFSLPIKALDTLKNTHKMYLSYHDAKMIENRTQNIYATPISENSKQYSLGSWSFLIGARNSIQYIHPEKKLATALINSSSNTAYQQIPQLIKESYQKFVQNKNKEVLQLRNLPLSKELKSKIGLKAVNWHPYKLVILFLVILMIVYYFFGGSFLPKINFLFFWHRYKHFQFGFILLIVIYIASVELLVYAEKVFYNDIGIKSQILNMTRSDLHSWLLITTVTGNSNGIFPLSLLGKGMLALNSLNFWIGTILIGISEYITYKINKKRKQGIMETKHTNHLVIFGWNNTAESFIAETIKDAKMYNNTKIKIACVVPDIKKVRNSFKTIKELHDKKRIDIIQGDALNTSVLELSNVQNANTVILLSEDGTKLSDERTAMRAHAISRYTKKKKNEGNIFKTSLITKLKTKISTLGKTKKEIIPSYKQFKIEKTSDTIYMIAELNDENFRDSLIDADVNEIIVGGNYRKAILKQSLFNHGISRVLDEIMQYNEFNEFYKIDLSLPENTHLQGKNYDELLLALRKEGILLIGVHIVFHDEDNNIIIDKNIIQQLLEQEEPEGITRDILVNPTNLVERNRIVDEDDHLIVLATNMKDLKKGVKNIKF